MLKNKKVKFKSRIKKELIKGFFIELGIFEDSTCAIVFAEKRLWSVDFAKLEFIDDIEAHLNWVCFVDSVPPGGVVLSFDMDGNKFSGMHDDFIKKFTQDRYAYAKEIKLDCCFWRFKTIGCDI